MSKLGKRMIKAMDEAIAIAKGEADPSTYRVHVPSSIDVRAVRLKLKMTQASSPAGLGLSSQRSGDWEQNSRVLLTIIEHEPEAVERALAIA
jgi:putative transcriptional regulator